MDDNHTNVELSIYKTSTSRQDTPLDKIHFHIVMEYLPVIIFTSSVCITGIIGNSFTILFYMPKLTTSSTSFLITVLAIVDIIVCVLGIGSVLDLCINILFSDRILCKAMYFLDQCMIYISVLILWIISIDRYTKLCRPLGFQFTIRKAKHAIIAISLFSVFVSIRDILTYDVIDVKIENLVNRTESIIGHYCTSSTDSDLKPIIFYSHIFDVGVITIVLITFGFTYSCIGWRLFKHKKYMLSSSVRPYSIEHEDSSCNSDIQVPYYKKLSGESLFNDNTDRTRKFGTVFAPITDDLKKGTSPDKNTFNDLDKKLSGDLNKKVSVLSTISVSGFTKSVSQMKQSERNVTMMMFAVSIGLAVCFAPYFIVSVTARVHTPGKIEVEPLVQLAVRSPFLNSVINPILFAMFNSKYRKYLKRAFCGCCKSDPVI